ncbi:MAG: alpha/beta hydrolase, partial [Lachnospiraceae bacterium]|nr:alpha/beta hydrolase [Lachnospiraceae bacterium]
PSKRGTKRTVPSVSPSVILLGHSHGGRTILRLLSRMAGDAEAGIAPEDFGFTVPKAILTDSAGIVPERTEEQKKRTQRYKTYKNILNKTGIAKVAPGTIDALQKKFGSADYAAASPVMRQSMVKVVNTDLQAEMPRIKIPVLLIWGDADTATPLSDGRRMEELMPEAGLAVIAGAGHYSFLDNPVLYNRIIGSFLGIV